MSLDTHQILENALRDGLLAAVKSMATSNYNNPFAKLMEAAIVSQQGELRKLLDESIASCIGDAEFRSNVASAVRASLAKTLVARFGGEMEKQVNVLKSDPSTRARITLAIDEIVKSQTH
jgi:hypothetical protein